MTELLKELEAVVERIRADSTEVRKVGIDPERERHIKRAAVNFIRTHHAEIAQALANAARYQWLRALPGNNAERAMCPNADGGVVMFQGRMLDERIDAAMHNSAGEAGE